MGLHYLSLGLKVEDFRVYGTGLGVLYFGVCVLGTGFRVWGSTLDGFALNQGALSMSFI